MKLMTKTLEARFAKIGSQEAKADPTVVAKFFNPAGSGTWLATEYDPENRIFFGYVSIFGDHCDEWGYFSLDELESVRCPVTIRMGDKLYRLTIKIERDLYFTEKPFSEALEEFKR
jgi:hypothetical protein